MTVLDRRPVRNPPPNTEVLFEEARRRRRHRRLKWLSVVVVVAGVGLITISRSSPTASPRHPGVPLASTPRPGDLPAGPIVALRQAGPLSPTGQLYVVDDSRDEVLVRVSSGQFRVVAGDGIKGFAGDGGSAFHAQLSDPSDIAVAPNGDLYVADGGRVRVIDRQGTIETVVGNGSSGGLVAAGTPAVSAPLGTQLSIAFSPRGALYVASLTQLFRVTPAGALDPIPVVVTSGPRLGAFDDFRQIAVDGQGNVYASSLYSGWSMFRISPTGAATYLGYDRRSGGSAAVVERGPAGAIEADNGPDVVRVQGNRLVVNVAINKVPSVGAFTFTSYFAIGTNGTLYADDLGPPAFEPMQQLVSVSHGHAESLWRGRPR
jgi:hypothetical protein